MPKTNKHKSPQKGGKVNKWIIALTQAKKDKVKSFMYNSNKYVLSKKSKASFPVYKKA